MVFLVIWIILTLSLPVIVMRLSNRSLVRSGKVKDNRTCKCKTTARIISAEEGGPINFDFDCKGIYTIAHYEFWVNGIRYHGVDQIYGNPFNTQTVTVLYDPKDPNNNCTQFGKRQDNGSNYLIALGITLGVIVVIVFGLILVAAFLGSAYR